MSEIRYFRLNGYDLINSPEFYVRVDDDNGRAICKLAIDNDGLFYYRPKSQILSDGENEGTRNTPHYYLSMEELKELFEALIKTGLPDNKNQPKRFSIKARGKEVTIRHK